VKLYLNLCVICTNRYAFLTFGSRPRMLDAFNRYSSRRLIADGQIVHLIKYDAPKTIPFGMYVRLMVNWLQTLCSCFSSCSSSVYVYNSVSQPYRDLKVFYLPFVNVIYPFLVQSLSSLVTILCTVHCYRKASNKRRVSNKSWALEETRSCQSTSYTLFTSYLYLVLI